MLGKILKLFGKAGKTVKEGVEKSTEFIDDTLDKEYIASGIDKAKELTGKVAEKAGEAYEKTKDAAEGLLENDKVKELTEKAKNVMDDVVEKGKDIVEDVSEKGKELADKAMENETISKVVSEVKETTGVVGDKLKDSFEELTGQTSEEE